MILGLLGSVYRLCTRVARRVHLEIAISMPGGLKQRILDVFCAPWEGEKGRIHHPTRGLREGDYLAGKSTRSYGPNKSNIDGSQLRLLELSFGLDPSNPLPWPVRVS